MKILIFFQSFLIFKPQNFSIKPLKIIFTFLINLLFIKSVQLCPSFLFPFLYSFHIIILVFRKCETQNQVHSIQYLIQIEHGKFFSFSLARRHVTHLIIIARALCSTHTYYNFFFSFLSFHPLTIYTILFHMRQQKFSLAPRQCCTVSLAIRMCAKKDS